MTLAHLIATKAGDWKRQQYAAETPLGDLHREIAEHMRAYAEGFGVDRLGYEGLCKAYLWTQGNAFPRCPVLLYDSTKLEDVGYRWIAVYPVTGTSEGHYVHVDLVQQGVGPHRDEERRIPLWQGKTFAGQEAAIQIAAELCRVLGV